MATSSSPQQNQLLAAMPMDAQRRIFPHLQLINLSSNTALYESGVSRRYVYFPTDSIMSLEHVLENGASAGISMVGNEGAVGLAAFMGSEFSPWRVVSQSAGCAYRVVGNLMREEFERHSEVLQLMLRYAQSRAAQMSQMAVCNRHHSVEQQLCRWLLCSLDRQSVNQLYMTQEQISNILGVRREGVTLAANKLNKLGAIEYSRGKISVLDRTKLEHISCECYEVVKKESNRLLPKVADNKRIYSYAPVNRFSLGQIHAFAAN
ncbi:MAG: Crp/Fnr family transcriptional regulator [Arenimonas sp.]